jgi:hypothetical protein
MKPVRGELKPISFNVRSSYSFLKFTVPALVMAVKIYLSTQSGQIGVPVLSTIAGVVSRKLCLLTSADFPPQTMLAAQLK